MSTITYINNELKTIHDTQWKKHLDECHILARPCRYFLTITPIKPYNQDTFFSEVYQKISEIKGIKDCVFIEEHDNTPHLHGLVCTVAPYKFNKLREISFINIHFTLVKELGTIIEYLTKHKPKSYVSIETKYDSVLQRKIRKIERVEISYNKPRLIE